MNIEGACLVRHLGRVSQQSTRVETPTILGCPQRLHTAAGIATSNIFPLRSLLTHEW
jgi:hypothetical protein